MNSKWEINKIGLVDFWYYDQQEFYFADGRMLLRGSNGSGKSVTMQSVVPLLLDGNMRPERLDPFGSRDRKMSNYLLEDNDDREERTGYLYMEMKRKESQTFLSIGIGMRARKGKPLDSWYFYISDGRRIGKDFQLFKETDVKITLTRQELGNRLGAGGKILTQTEYQEYVNRQIFGFETVEEYKEMIDLLIQLRTPKLSKDFKPSVINEILSNSLQSLSEEDLRPMSEAIENMDTLTTNLTNKSLSKQAADKILKNYQKYNEYILYEKGRQFLDNRMEHRKIMEKEEKDKQIILECNETMLTQETKVTTLEAEQKTLEKEKESLSASNVLALKKQEEDVDARIGEAKKEIAEKDMQLEAKQSQWNDCNSRKKHMEEEGSSKQEQVFRILEEMRCCSEGSGFDEFQFMEGEIKENPEEEYVFEPHMVLVRKLLENLENGAARLREAEAQREKAEDYLQQFDGEKRNRDAAERRANEYEALFSQVQGELKEAVYAWSGSNQELKLSDLELKEISRFIDAYEIKSDYHDITASVSARQLLLKEERFQEKNTVVLDLEGEKRKLRDLEEECQSWRDKKEAEPECSRAVLENRAHLTKLGIPYHRFYQVVDFEDRLEEAECGRIEEALLEMGILDALVIDKEYKETVLKTDKGLCDKYIFTGNAHVKENMLELINISEEANDIFLNQKITGILGGIGYGREESTYINQDGTYGMGILTGTVTGEYRSKYIGEKVRAAHRLQTIKELEEKIAAQSLITGELQGIIEEFDRRITVLEEEYYALPTDTDLRIACTDFTESQNEITRIAQNIIRLEEQIRQQQEKIKKIMTEASQIADKVYLPCRLDIFEKVRESMQEYQKLLYDLRITHSGYLQNLVSIRSLEETMDNYDADMDNIRYDLLMKKRSLEKDEMESVSIKEQLALTNYDQVKERLDQCLERLKLIPGEIKGAVALSAEAKSKAEQLMILVEQEGLRLNALKEKVLLLERIVLEETKLSYVPIPYDLEDKENFARNLEKMQQTMQPVFQGTGKEELTSKLNASYFENRTFLIDYNLTMDYIFQELQDPSYQDISPRRAELRGKYRGNTIKFQELAVLLQEEMEELGNLIKTKEKDLFEDILANIISRKIRSKINSSMAWVGKMNQLMESMNTSSGLKLSLRWRSKTAEVENQLDTGELVELLRKDSKLMTDEEFDKLSVHFRSKVQEARRNSKDSNGVVSFFTVMRDTLDYRKWFEFQLFSQKTGENKKELTNSVFGTFSGGEKAMSMYVPLFSAVVAKYKGARSDAPRIISLDEAFAGVDNKNIRDMFRLMMEFEFNFIINSQILWGDCDTCDSLAIYHLIRPENVKFVTVMSYLWNGKVKRAVEDMEEMRSAGS